MHDTPSPRRARPTYAAASVITIALGLVSRRFAASLPEFVRLYAGDALWAAAVYFLAATLSPRTRIAWLAAGTLTFAFAIEASQLYHAPWIDGVRSTRLGALVLGQGFLWSDLVCYTIGVIAAALVDQAMSRRHADRER
jgi:hypothetical protein